MNIATLGKCLTQAGEAGAGFTLPALAECPPSNGKAACCLVERPAPNAAPRREILHSFTLTVLIEGWRSATWTGCGMIQAWPPF